MRLSASETQQLISQIEDFKIRVQRFNLENDELKRRLQENGIKLEGTVRDNQTLAGQIR